MKGVPDTRGRDKADTEVAIDGLVNQHQIVAECAVRSMLFLQGIKKDFKEGKIKNGNDLVASFESGLAALNDDDD